MISNNNDNDLMLMGADLLTQEHYLAAIKKDHMIMKQVPKKFYSNEFFELAIESIHDPYFSNGIFADELRFIPIEFKTPSLCLKAVKMNGLNLEHCELKTARLCNAAIQNNGLAIRFVPDELLNSKLCHDAVENNFEALYYVKDEFKTTEMCLMALRANTFGWTSENDIQFPDVFNWVPERLHSEEMVSIVGCRLSKLKIEQTKELCLISVTKRGCNLEHVKPEFRTRQVQFAAVAQSGLALKFVPHDEQTKALCKLAVNENFDSLCYVAKKYRSDPEVYNTAIRKNGLALKHIPHEEQTYDMCMFAVALNGKAIKYVNPKLMDSDICRTAVYNTCEALSEIPIDSEHLTYDTCLEAVRQKGYMVDNVPEKFRTQELYENAVIQKYDFVERVPPEFRTEQMLRYALYVNMATTSPQNKYSRLFRELPIEMRTEEMFMKYGVNLHDCKHLPYTNQMCLRSVTICGYQLYKVPIKLRTDEIFTAAVAQDGFMLSEVPMLKKTYELCLLAVKQKGTALKFVPEKFYTQELLMASIKSEPDMILHVNLEHWTSELFMQAITNSYDGWNLLKKLTIPE